MLSLESSLFHAISSDSEIIHGLDRAPTVYTAENTLTDFDYLLIDIPGTIHTFSWSTVSLPHTYRNIHYILPHLPPHFHPTETKWTITAGTKVLHQPLGKTVLFVDRSNASLLGGDLYFQLRQASDRKPTIYGVHRSLLIYRMSYMRMHQSAMFGGIKAGLTGPTIAYNPDHG